MNHVELEATTGSSGISRRELMKVAAGMVACTVLMPRNSMAQCCQAKSGTVRDRLWLFAAPRSADYHWTHRRSLMTPTEGAYYLSIPNVIMVQALPKQDEPETRPFESPLKQYTFELRPLKRFVWSITGSAGYTTPDYRKEVLDLATTTSNCVGLYMDDFFFTGKKLKTTGQRAVLSIDELKQIRQQAITGPKKLDIWVTFYTMLLDLPLQDYLKLIDVLTIWTWNSEELKKLESNFRRIEALGPHLRKTLGCYFYDYTLRKPLTVADMKYQCEMGLEWLRQGKIEGMVFLDNPAEDQGYECVEWARNWIQKVGEIAV